MLYLEPPTDSDDFWPSLVASVLAWVAAARFEGKDVIRLCLTNGESNARRYLPACRNLISCPRENVADDLVKTMNSELGNKVQAPDVRRLLIAQFGDYGEAEYRFARGGEETYYGQRYTVEFVASLVRTGYQVMVISLEKDTARQRLSSGVESVGIQLYPGRLRLPRTRALIRIASQWRPSHLLLHSPILELLNWARAHRVKTLPLLADSFQSSRFRDLLRYRRLATALNDSVIPWVANHGSNACTDLVRIGVNPEKILPFDLPAFDSPSKWTAKRSPQDPSRVTLTYVGQITASKGVGDLINAVGLANRAGERYELVLAGRGDVETFRTMAYDLGIGDHVHFLGLVPRPRALEAMNAGDVVVVPSRHEYPEGMPHTIYEGLVSRSPIVVSDHPMFVDRVIDRQNGLIFRASNPHSLYETVHRLVHDKLLYEKLSEHADLASQTFHGPLKWDHLISRWLSDNPDDKAWLAQFAIMGSSTSFGSKCPKFNAEETILRKSSRLKRSSLRTIGTAQSLFRR